MMVVDNTPYNCWENSLPFECDVILVYEKTICVFCEMNVYVQFVVYFLLFPDHLSLVMNNTIWNDVTTCSFFHVSFCDDGVDDDDDENEYFHTVQSDCDWNYFFAMESICHRGHNYDNDAS